MNALEDLKHMKTARISALYWRSWLLSKLKPWQIELLHEFEKMETVAATVVEETIKEGCVFKAAKQIAGTKKRARTLEHQIWSLISLGKLQGRREGRMTIVNVDEVIEAIEEHYGSTT